MSKHPKHVPQPQPNQIVQVVMTEAQARAFEAQCLGRATTRGYARLSAPVLLAEDDLPTYFVGLHRAEPTPTGDHRATGDRYPKAPALTP
jgi:hypothetical protein